MPQEQPSVRYSLLDAIRAVAIVNMIAYHLCYNIFCVFGVWEEFCFDPIVKIWERLICCTFILVSGMAINFSRHGYRRGIIVLLCGWLITLITVFVLPEQQIWYGVLNLLGVGMILTTALKKPLSRISPLAGMIVFFLLFMLCYGIPYRSVGVFGIPPVKLPDTLYRIRALAFLGFPDDRFSSGDYFPLLPWIFLYLCGFELWRWIAKTGWDRFFTRRIPVLDFIGRHSLIIYMAHQPILYGLCRLIFRNIG